MSRNCRTFESVSNITDIRNYNNSISLTGELPEFQKVPRNARNIFRKMSYSKCSNACVSRCTATRTYKKSYNSASIVYGTGFLNGSSKRENRYGNGAKAIR